MIPHRVVEKKFQSWKISFNKIIPTYAYDDILMHKMIRYYDLIKSFYTEEEFELLLENKLHLPDDVDLNPGSGFHYRIRKHYPHAEKTKQE